MILKAIKWHLKLWKIFNEDRKKYSGYCAGSPISQKNGAEAARNILVFCHMVEKGLSHKELKPLFGYDRVQMIAESLERYISQGGADPFIIGLAGNTIQKYNDVNRELGVSEEKMIPIPSCVQAINDVNVGIFDVSEEDYFSKCSASFSALSEARHSVRLYDCVSAQISEDELISCIRTAQNSPSACNRQGVRVKIVKNPELIKKICDVQGGSKGFGENAGALLVITSDYSLYEPSERRMPMLDCGIFIMNLLYALYEKGLGTCVLNGSFNSSREAKMKDLVHIPECEEYAAVIAVSKIPKGEMIKIARSSKRNVEDIVEVIS